MERYMKFFMVIVCFLLLVGTANAQHLSDVSVRYDSRYFPEFVYGRGGPEGHSGAYISIIAGIDRYNDIKKIKVKAKHIASDFEVSLVEDDPACVGVGPFANDQSFGVWLRPQHWWMTGAWEITLKYKKNGTKEEETATVIVPRFNFPPEPTGIQIAEWDGKTWLVWNRIGDPGTFPGQHVQYRIAHFTTPAPYCIDEWYYINGGGANINYQLWSGNRIAVEPPAHWVSGDLVRIENRVYDDKDDVHRHDRGVRFFFLP